MKKSHDNGMNRTLARLKIIRLVLLFLGLLLSVAVTIVYIRYDPLTAMNSEEESQPRSVTILPQETQEEEVVPSSEPASAEPGEQVTDGDTEKQSFEEERTGELDEDNKQVETPYEEKKGESDKDNKQVERSDSSKNDLTEKYKKKDATVLSGTVKQAAISLEPDVRKPETEPTTVIPADEIDAEVQEKQWDHAKIAFVGLCVFLGIDIAVIIVVSVMIFALKKKLPVVESQIHIDAPWTTNAGENRETRNTIQIAGLHNIGARPYQEDSMGAEELNDGILAVVADGMGGLSGGDRVSQKIVYTMLEYGKKLPPDQIDGVLETMVNGVNQEVNQMLGPDGLYKSGSTLLAVLIRNHQFQWITVGDSRIYYYHQGRLSQLNQEHNVGQDMLIKATRGELSFEDARNAPKKGRVTSFIGMGTLKYVDKSCRSIKLEAGDRLLLMTDGVFNALPDQTILSVLANYPDVQMEATKLEQFVLQAGHPKQDNFTAIILGC